MSNTKKLKKNMFSQYVLQFSKYVFPLIITPYLTRVLGRDVYAVRAYIIAYMSFMMVLFDFGFDSHGIKFIAQNRAHKLQVEIETTVIVVLRFLLFFVGAAITAVSTYFIPIMAANVAFVVISFIRAFINCSLPDFIFKGYEEMEIITYRYVVSQIIGMVLILVFVKSPDQLLLIPIFELVTTLIAVVWTWHNVIVVRDIHFRKFTIPRAIESFMHSGIFFLSSATSLVFNTLTTLVMGITISNPAIISYWSLSVTAIGAVQSLYNPIANSLYPHLVANHNFKLLRKLLLIGLPAVLIGTVAFWHLAPFGMLVLGGKQYIDGAYIMRYLSPVLITSFIAIMIGYPVLAVVDKEKELTKTSIMAAIFHTIGLGILIIIGQGSIIHFVILRNCTELVLCCGRMFYSRSYLFSKTLPGEKA